MQCTSYTSAAPARRSQLAAVTCQSKRLLLAGSNLQVASRSFQYRHGTQVRLRQLQLEGPAQTMFRGIVFCESPIVLQGKCKKPVLNETPLIKWSLIILRLTHIYIYTYLCLNICTRTLCMNVHLCRYVAKGKKTSRLRIPHMHVYIIYIYIYVSGWAGKQVA